MKIPIVCFLSFMCWLLYERVILTKDLSVANAQIEKMAEVQIQLDQARIEIARLKVQPKMQSWFESKLGGTTGLELKGTSLDEPPTRSSRNQSSQVRRN